MQSIGYRIMLLDDNELVYKGHKVFGILIKDAAPTTTNQPQPKPQPLTTLEGKPSTKARRDKEKGITRLWFRWQETQKNGCCGTLNKNALARFYRKHIDAIKAISEIQTKKQGHCRAAPATFFCILYERNPELAMESATAFYRPQNIMNNMSYDAATISDKIADIVFEFTNQRGDECSLFVLELCLESIKDMAINAV